MKNHFNLRRFGLLFRKHTVEHYKTYLMSLLVLFGTLTLVLGTVLYLNGGRLGRNPQEILFAFFLLAAGMIFTSTVFANLGNSKHAIAFLTLPASTLEKFLVAWIYSFLIFCLLFVPIFLLASSMVISMEWHEREQSTLVNLLDTDRQLYVIFAVYALLHALALLGSIFFRKSHFIKTVFTGFVVAVLVVILNKLSLEMLLGRRLDNAIPFGRAGYSDEGYSYLSMDLPDMQPIMLVYVALALLIWAAAYFKLKEKQV
jgi:hypothetical protein